MNLAYAAPEAPTAEAVLSLNAMDLILNAGPVVKLVMFILFGFSVVSWAIILFKWGTIRRSYGTTERFLDVFWSGKSMDHIYSEAKKYPAAPVAKIFQSGYVELQRIMERQRKGGGGSKNPLTLVPPDSSISNLERALTRASRSETQRLERSLNFLATSGSTAPFIGLFGTVWGIMNSFQALGNVSQATLAMVAPGISEALIATAMGLFAAIPAVIAYNRFASHIDRLVARYEMFAEEFLAILRRQINN